MQTNYKAIFSVSTFHTYFSNNINSKLEFIPDNDTRALMQKYGLRVKPSANGFSLYANINETINDFLDQVSQASGINSFDFNIVTKDPSFYNYTELSLDFRGLLSYSSEDELNQNENGRVTLHGRIDETEGENKLGELRVGFNDLKEGLATNDSIDFTINFDARSTRWQYYFINQSQLNLENMHLRNADNIQFNGPVETTMANGQKALLMTSETLLALSEIYQHKIDLIITGNNSEEVIINLPAPNQNQLSIIETNGEKVACSPVYVYV